MCIAILNKSALLSRESMKNCWDANRDGAGFLYTDGTELKRFAELKSFDAWYSAYTAARISTSLPMLVHFRITTSGEVNDTNCHPFLVPGTDWGLVHNGVINCHSTKKHSDTWHFANWYVTEFKDPSSLLARAMMTDFIGTYNKILFLNSTGEYFMLNESKGHWDEAKDTWYSNDGYKERGVMYYGNERITVGNAAGYRGGAAYDDSHWLDYDDKRDFRRGLDAEDDDARYQRQWGDSKPTTSIISSAKLHLFKKELKTRAQTGARIIRFGGAMEAEYKLWAATQPLPISEALEQQFEADYIERKFSPETATPFSDPKIEARFLVWAKEREEQGKGGTGTAALSNETLAGYGLLAATYADFPEIDGPNFANELTAWMNAHSQEIQDAKTSILGQKKSDSASSSVTANVTANVTASEVGRLGYECMTCNSSEIEHDTSGMGGLWCHTCDEYKNDEDVLDIASNYLLTELYEEFGIDVTGHLSDRSPASGIEATGSVLDLMQHGAFD